jgi:hypothetical protein
VVVDPAPSPSPAAHPARKSIGTWVIKNFICQTSLMPTTGLYVPTASARHTNVVVLHRPQSIWVRHLEGLCVFSHRSHPHNGAPRREDGLGYADHRVDDAELSDIPQDYPQLFAARPVDYNLLPDPSLGHPSLRVLRAHPFRYAVIHCSTPCMLPRFLVPSLSVSHAVPPSRRNTERVSEKGWCRRPRAFSA